MPQLDLAAGRPVIRNGAVVADDWLAVADAAALAAAPADGALLVPLALWKEQGAALAGRSRVGVALAPADEPGELAAVVDQLALIAIEFPAFTDGRGYSIARLLRERYGYRGELRAFGDVQRDQLFYLLRCGFDAFALRADRDPVKALDAYRDFSEAYQSAVDRPEPLFRRRAAGLVKAA